MRAGSDESRRQRRAGSRGEQAADDSRHQRRAESRQQRRQQASSRAEQAAEQNAETKQDFVTTDVIRCYLYVLECFVHAMMFAVC
jgi:hypothetical protein